SLDRQFVGNRGLGRLRQFDRGQVVVRVVAVEQAEAIIATEATVGKESAAVLCPVRVVLLWCVATALALRLLVALLFAALFVFGLGQLHLRRGRVLDRLGFVRQFLQQLLCPGLVAVFALATACGAGHVGEVLVPQAIIVIVAVE